MNNKEIKIYQPTTNQKEAGLAIVISDRADFRASRTIWDKEGLFIINKESVLQTDTPILNVTTLNN